MASKLLVTRDKSQAAVEIIKDCHCDIRNTFASISSSTYSSFYPAATAGIKTTVGIFEDCNRRHLHPSWHQNIQRQHAASKMLVSQGERGSSWHHLGLPSAMGIKMVFIFSIRSKWQLFYLYCPSLAVFRTGQCNGQYDSSGKPPMHCNE